MANRYRQRIACMLALFLSVAAAAPGREVWAEAEAVRLKMNGTAIKLEHSPFKDGEHLFIPLRGVFESLKGTKVGWDEATRSATAEMKDKSVAIRIQVTIGSREAEINGNKVELEQPVRLVDGATMVPVRKLNEAIGNRVEWEEETQTIHLIRNGLGRRITNPEAGAQTEGGGAVSVDGKAGSKPGTAVGSEGVVTAAAEAADRYLQEAGFNGTALVARKGELLLERGYGQERPGKSNGPDTRFRLMSLTKGMTATAILRLEEQGLLNTSDSIQTYVPGLPQGDKITIRHLLSHTSGLPREYPRTSDATLEQTLDAIRKSEPLFEPGEKFSYSNAGYVVLAAVIEKVTGKSYGDYVRSTLFAPLGMERSGQSSPAYDAEHLAAGYWLDGGKLKPETYHVSQPGAGDLYSTVRDLYVWDRALYTERLLKPESVGRLFAPNLGGYGYGWYVKEPQTAYHTGSGSGFSTMFYRKLDEELVVILLSNVTEADVKGMTQKILTLLPQS